MASFAAVMGPWAYVLHLLSGPRLPFTSAYLGSIALTLYFSIGVNISQTSGPPSHNCTDDFMAASKHAFDPIFCHSSDCMPSLVFDQLLPNGRHWLASRDDLWRAARRRLDDRVTDTRSSSEPWELESLARVGVASCIPPRTV